MSILPVGLALPPPMVPTTPLPTPRKACRRSCHCFSNSVRWTSTRVFTPRRAMIAAAVTVLPKAVGAHSTPASCFSMAATACLLVRPQRADEVDFDGLAGEPLVLQIAADAVVSQQGKRCIEAAARQGDVLRVVLGAADDARLVPHRHAHGLGLVELGVLEGRQADQPVGQRLRQLRSSRSRSGWPASRSRPAASAPASLVDVLAWRFHGVARSSSSMKVTSSGWTPPVARRMVGSMSCGAMGWIAAR